MCIKAAWPVCCSGYPGDSRLGSSNLDRRWFPQSHTIERACHMSLQIFIYAFRHDGKTHLF